MLAKSFGTWLSGLSLATLLLFAATGCQLIKDRPDWTKNPFGKEEETVVPTRMMVMWADTVLHQPQQAGVRGFGARIYFYSEDGPDPVKVDGGLAVYAFDADELNPKSAKPKRKFVFTADQFAEYMSHTSMGTSYSVWCPWDEVGGYNEQLSLIVRFEGRSGGVVISDATVKLLPGLNKPTDVAARPIENGFPVTQAFASGDAGSSIQLAGFERSVAGSTLTKPPRRQTETIDLPPSFYRHLSGPKEQLGTAPTALVGPEATESDSTDAELAESKHDEITSSSTPPRRVPYPQRTLGDKQLDASAQSSRQHPSPSGWIPQLPKTPRYGYPNAKPASDAVAR